MKITTNVIISGICSFVFIFLIVTIQEVNSVVIDVSVGDGECCDSKKCTNTCHPLYLLYQYSYDPEINKTSQCFLILKSIRSGYDIESISQKYRNTTKFILIDTLHSTCLESFIYPIWIISIFILFLIGPVFNLYLFIKSFCFPYTTDDFQI